MPTAAMTVISLEPVQREELADVTRRIQAAFAPAVEKETGHPLTAPIPSDRELETSFEDPAAEVLHVVADGQRVGGAVVLIDRETRRNSLELFFIDVGREGGGLGRLAWEAIEARYPDTEVWETFTPMFELRNIHFYINVCGFRAVEFYHEGHPHPEPPDADGEHPEADRFPGEDRGFRFEKVMASSAGSPRP